MVIRAVLLDMDGTIWDSPVDWAGLRCSLGLPEDGRPIVEHLKQATADDRARGLALLQEHEARGASCGRLMPGTHELIEFLASRGLRSALVTNNSRASVGKVLSQHKLRFDLIVSRDEIPMKPAAEAFLEPLRKLACTPEEAVAIGDSHLDVLAARAAGIPHMILVAPKDWARRMLPADAPFTEVSHLEEARRTLEQMLSDTPHAGG